MNGYELPTYLPDYHIWTRVLIWEDPNVGNLFAQVYGPTMVEKRCRYAMHYTTATARHGGQGGSLVPPRPRGRVSHSATT